MAFYDQPRLYLILCYYLQFRKLSILQYFPKESIFILPIFNQPGTVPTFYFKKYEIRTPIPYQITMFLGY